MRVNDFLLILLAWALFSQCHPGNSRKNDRLWFELNSIQKHAGDCDETSLACARVDIKYPLAKCKNEVACKAINSSILNVVVQFLAFEAPVKNASEQYLHLMADSFLLEWKNLHEKEPELTASTGWEVTINGEAAMRTPKVATVSLSAYSYAGGAYPNSSVTILNFDAATGNILHWEDLILDNPAFLELAEHHFRKARELQPGSDLKKEGFFMEEGFKLPQNFEIQEEGIYFWYNPYEAASYAQGQTDFLIPYQELGELIRKELIFEVTNYKGS